MTPPLPDAADLARMREETDARRDREAARAELGALLPSAPPVGRELLALIARGLSLRAAAAATGAPEAAAAAAVTEAMARVRAAAGARPARPEAPRVRPWLRSHPDARP